MGKVYTPLTQTWQNATQTAKQIVKGCEGRSKGDVIVIGDTGRSGAIGGEQHNAIQLN